jgi:excisionase family DNA binding protein
MTDLLTPDQVAEILSVSRARVIAMARGGGLPSLRLGREYRFPRANSDGTPSKGGRRMTTIGLAVLAVAAIVAVLAVIGLIGFFAYVRFVLEADEDWVDVRPERRR